MHRIVIDNNRFVKCNGSHVNNTIKTSLNKRVCGCLFVSASVCVCVWMCESRIQVIRLPIQSIIILPNVQCSSYLPWIFSYFYWLFSTPSETCVIWSIHLKIKKDWNLLSTYFTYSLPLLWLHFNEVYRCTFGCSQFPPPSFFRPTFVCVIPIHGVSPSLYLPKKMNWRFIQLDIWREKKTV